MRERGREGGKLRESDKRENERERKRERVCVCGERKREKREEDGREEWGE